MDWWAGEGGEYEPFNSDLAGREAGPFSSFGPAPAGAQHHRQGLDSVGAMDWLAGAEGLHASACGRPCLGQPALWWAEMNQAFFGLMMPEPFQHRAKRCEPADTCTLATLRPAYGLSSLAIRRNVYQTNSRRKLL